MTSFNTVITASSLTCDITPPGEGVVRAARAAKVQQEQLDVDATVKVQATRLTCDVQRPGFHANPEHQAYMVAKANLAAHAAKVATAEAAKVAKEDAAWAAKLADCAVLADIRKQLRN